MHNLPPQTGETFLIEFMGDKVPMYINVVSKEQPKAPKQYHILDHFKEDRWIERKGDNWVEATVLKDDRIHVNPGLYRHYKGNLYRVVGTIFDTEREIDVVVYLPCYPCVYPGFTVSTKKFTSLVKRDGEPPIKRFTECTTTVA